MFDEAAIKRLYRRLRARDPLGPSVRATKTLAGDIDLNPGFVGRRRQGARAASVLMPLVDRATGISILLTERTDDLQDHAGQVSFPGGSRETQDIDEIETALRETEEEVGIARGFIDVIGTLDMYQTGTGFDITPVVGVVGDGFSLTIDAKEVAQVFEVPLDFILDSANHETHRREFNGVEFNYYALPWDGHYIWGATAAMLVNLARVLAVHSGISDQGGD